MYTHNFQLIKNSNSYQLIIFTYYVLLLISFAIILQVPRVNFVAIAVAPHPAPKSKILSASFLACRMVTIFFLSSRMNLVSAWPPGQYIDQNGSWNTFLIEGSNLLFSHLSTKGSWYKGQFFVNRNNFNSGVRWSRVISVFFKIVFTTSGCSSMNLLSDVLRLLRRKLSHISFVLFENFRAERFFFERTIRLTSIAILEICGKGC